VEGSQSPEDAAVACGLVIDAAGATAATQQHALLVQAEIRRRLAQLDLAMTDCDEAIRRDPASAQAFDLRGRVRTDAKQYELALDDFDRAIRLDKDLASAFAGRAAVFALTRQHRHRPCRERSQALRQASRRRNVAAPDILKKFAESCRLRPSPFVWKKSTHSEPDGTSHAAHIDIFRSGMSLPDRVLDQAADVSAALTDFGRLLFPTNRPTSSVSSVFERSGYRFA
jgi:tetratricopeptide (TPR) repeat protein